MFSILDVDDQTKYILPLDAIDLAYLPVYRQRDKGNLVPLWTPHNDDRYFEFEVLQTEKESNPAKSVQKEESSEQNKENLNLTTYLKIITAMSDKRQKLTYSLKVVDEKTLEVQFENNQRVCISVENFHGYYDVESKTLCRLCRTIIGQKEMHKLNERHMELVMSPITDNHCIRQIDQLWSHCILCNEIIENKEFHITCSSTHDLKLQEALTISREALNNDRKGNANAALSYNNKMGTTGKIETINNNRKHDTAAVKINKVLDTFKSYDDKLDTSEDDLKHILKKSRRITYCDICDIKVHVTNLKKHLTSECHRQRAFFKESEIRKRNTAFSFPSKVNTPVVNITNGGNGGTPKNKGEMENTSKRELEIQERIQKLIARAKEQKTTIIENEKSYKQASVLKVSKVIENEKSSKTAEAQAHKLPNLIEEKNPDRIKQYQLKKETQEDIDERIKNLIARRKKNNENDSVNIKEKIVVKEQRNETEEKNAPTTSYKLGRHRDKTIITNDEVRRSLILKMVKQS